MKLPEWLGEVNWYHVGVGALVVLTAILVGFAAVWMAA
jgi:hypothetical protein